jgi:hypothetical protein
MLDPLLARIDEVLAERMAMLGDAHDEGAGRLDSLSVLGHKSRHPV